MIEKFNIVNRLPENVIFTNVDKVLNLARANSVWYLLMGLACCAIELMQTGGPRADIDRFGSLFYYNFFLYNFFLFKRDHSHLHNEQCLLHQNPQ